SRRYQWALAPEEALLGVFPRRARPLSPPRRACAIFVFRAAKSPAPPAHDTAARPIKINMSDSPLTVPIESPRPNFLRNPQLPIVLLRVFMYLVLVEAFTYEFFWLANFSGLMGRPALNPRSLITGETIRLAAVLAGAWVMSRLERRSLGDYGLPLPGGLAKHFCQ